MTALPRRPLGTSGLEITTAGFGAWAAGGPGWAFGWRGQRDDDSIAAIRHAVEAGIDWIDTAPVYGLGHSEEVVATALEVFAEDERPLVFTKCGLQWDERDPAAPHARVGVPARIRADVEASLRRLRVERLDLLQMHWPAEDGTPLASYWETLLELRAAGHVRAVGLSNHSVEQLDAAEALGHVDSLQPPFSAVDRRAAAEIAWCAKHGTGVVVYSPMQSGLLSGSMTAERAAALPPDDWRSQNPQFRGERLAGNLRIADALGAVAARHGVPAAAVAVAWALAWPGVTGAIVGARTASQIDGWLPGGSLPLTASDLDEIAVVLRGAGVGPACPGEDPPRRARRGRPQ